MNNVAIRANKLTSMEHIVALDQFYYNNFFLHILFHKNINIIMFGNWKGINSMGLSASFTDYKNTSQT